MFDDAFLLDPPAGFPCAEFPRNGILEEKPAPPLPLYVQAQLFVLLKQKPAISINGKQKSSLSFFVGMNDEVENSAGTAAAAEDLSQFREEF